MAYIYQIVNTQNNKRYIGSSCDFKKRKNQHLKMLKNKTHHNNHLQNAWNKYKECSFKFEVLEECNLEQQFIREQYYLDNFKPEYNLDMIAKHGETKTLSPFINTCNYCGKEFESPTKRKKICIRCDEIKRAVWCGKDYIDLLHLKGDDETEQEFYALAKEFDSRGSYSSWSYIGDEDLRELIDDWYENEMEK